MPWGPFPPPSVPAALAALFLFAASLIGAGVLLVLDSYGGRPRGPHP